MQRLVIANRKGGSGKTTTAVNLAAFWANQGQRVLVLDLDTQGHAAIGLGLPDPNHGPGLHRIFTDHSQSLASLVQESAYPGVSLIAASHDYLGDGQPNPMHLKTALANSGLLDQFDRIIMDTPPTQDSLLINALNAADGVLIPFVPDPLSSMGVRQLARLFARIAATHNPHLQWLGLIPVRCDRRLRLQQQILLQLSREFGAQRLLRGIRNNVKLAEAFAAGCPITQFDRHCAGSMDYQLLAAAVDTLAA